MIALAVSRRALADLERSAAFDGGAEALSLIEGALRALRDHPFVGRSVGHGLRELVISRGRTGYVALYAFDEARDEVVVHAVRHQREAGYVD